MSSSLPDRVMVFQYWFFGSIPFLNDALHILAIDEANCLQNLFTNHVGALSGLHCLADEFMMILENSTVVTYRNVESESADRGSACGAGSVD